MLRNIYMLSCSRSSQRKLNLLLFIQAEARNEQYILHIVTQNFLVNYLSSFGIILA